MLLKTLAHKQHEVIPQQKTKTPLGKISIVLRLCKLRPRKDEILHSGVVDFPILYFPVYTADLTLSNTKLISPLERK
jgi:hypothetical protein